MLRKIIKIDEEKCNGCGLCAAACHEGAIAMQDGKARLMRDDYCDGLGDCLPVCPTGAITFEEREAAAYDEAAVKARMAAQNNAASCAGGCPGSAAHTIRPAAPESCAVPQSCDIPQGGVAPPPAVRQSRLQQWPVQIKLAPPNAPYFAGVHLLVAADCTAYAYAAFHEDFMENRITLIGCPKLDEGDYTDKLAQIIAENDIQSVTVARMQVPCCGGIENAAKTALQRSGKTIPLRVATIAPNGLLVNG